ncbi:EcsC family protein [Aeromonas enteropelogenes]|uniref:EcsC family protein n=1 Tax=Aeromonas enteropelogenes TaxID=29489 RepID=UPI00398999F0
MSESENDKPVLLKAIELVLADPKTIREEALSLKRKYEDRYKEDRTQEEIEEYAADKIISNYSYYTAFIGGAIPGLGTAISTFGGATADAALPMKYQIEMTMALATIYGHDITNAEAQRICLIVAGLGTINEAAKEGGKEVTKQAFIKMTQQYLKGATLAAVKEIFKKVGITFTRKAVEKSIPFGVGVVIGFSANKGLTWYVGTKAKDFFSFTEE